MCGQLTNDVRKKSFGSDAQKKPELTKILDPNCTYSVKVLQFIHV
jgi:hypothetical protein